MKTKNKISTFILLIVITAGMFVACNKDDGASPSISFIRVTDPDKSDSLLVGAYLGDLIAIRGTDLQNLTELWFNDQKAKLNPTYITSATVIVNIPGNIPKEVTDTMTMKFSDGQVLKYPFKVLVPAPSVKSMVCEYVPEGEIAVIKGDFFIAAEGQNEPNVYFAGNVKAEVVSFTKEEIQVTVPKEATVGKITVESIYGKSISAFTFRDNTNVIVDFDSYSNPWGLGAIADADGCSGKYLNFVGEIGAWQWQNPFMFGYWSNTLAPVAQGSIDALTLRFEVDVIEWSDTPMLIWFATEGEGISPDENYAQAHWKPWLKDGEKSTYSTGGWITVSIPLSDFIYNKEESSSDLKIDDISKYSNINFMLFGAADGTYPIDVRIDNVRIVPM